MARLKEKYKKEIAPALAKEFDIKNPMAIPKIEKIVVNMGLGEATANAKILDVATEELKSITGQKPVITKAKNRSLHLSCDREWLSARWSRFAATGCMSFSIV